MDYSLLLAIEKNDVIRDAEYYENNNSSKHDSIQKSPDN